MVIDKDAIHAGAEVDADRLQQFSRLLLLAEFDEQGLAVLQRRRVLIVGLGGLGSPVALYLAKSGLAEIHLADFDTVALSNLPRQVLYGPADIGRPKADALAERLRLLAPETAFHGRTEAADGQNLRHWVGMVDLVIDCTDNFSSRQAINRACHEAARPLVCASALQWSGQLLVVDPGQPQAGCYACLFHPDTPPQEASCGAYGVMTTAVGTMGLLAANEALKILMGMTPASGRLLIFDAKEPRFETLRFTARADCPVCQVSGKA
ncbi:MAG: hypothetical protein RLZZ344_630 [Pseudomonadota bacterium]